MRDQRKAETTPKGLFIRLQTQFVFTWETELRIERSRRMKSHSGLKLVSDSCTNSLIFPMILPLILLNTWIKLPILQTIFILAIMNVDFIPSFIQEWNFDPSLHDSESIFYSGSSVQSGMKNGMNSIRRSSCNSIRIHINKYNSIPWMEWVRSGMKLNPDSCKHPLSHQV